MGHFVHPARACVHVPRASRASEGVSFRNDFYYQKHTEKPIKHANTNTYARHVYATSGRKATLPSTGRGDRGYYYQRNPKVPAAGHSTPSLS
eukprot:1718559-Pleurochrysis_carterae.AAC.1